MGLSDVLPSVLSPAAVAALMAWLVPKVIKLERTLAVLQERSEAARNALARLEDRLEKVLGA